MKYQEIEDQQLIPLYAKRGISLERGEGVWVYDEQGKKYLDLMTGYGPNILGHAHPAVTRAISEQAGKLLSCHHSFYNQQRGALTEKLVSIINAIGTGISLNRIFYNNSGAESVEAAIKFARVASGKSGMIATKMAYHGRTFGALAATGSDKYRTPYAPMLESFVHVPYEDIGAMEAAITPDIGAVILEPIQGESGIRLPYPKYLQEVRALCDRHGLLLILDEVQTGFRTGSWFAFQQSGMMPDILCISKALASGLPAGVTAVTEAVSQKIPKGTHGNTFGGNPLICAASLATIEAIERDDLNTQARETGAYFLAQLKNLTNRNIREARGQGLMIALELKDKCTPYVKKLQDEGILVIPTGSNTIRFLPALIIEREHIDLVIGKLADILG